MIEIINNNLKFGKRPGHYFTIRNKENFNIDKKFVAKEPKERFLGIFFYNPPK